MLRSFAVLAICLGLQAADSGGPAFEVASIKPSGPIDRSHEQLFAMIANDNNGSFVFLAGHGRRIEVHGMSAAELTAAAFRVPLRTVEGPSWMFDTRFDVDALIPADQPRDKAPEMLRTLLQERLALQAHREVRRMPGFTLSVAEGGPKLKETGPFTPTDDTGTLTNHSGPRFNGFRARLNHCDMAQLANTVSQQLKAPVEDRTGLKGFYEVEIRIAGEDMRDEGERPSRFREALSAYGLRLAPGRIDAPILVVDNLSKVPSEN